MPLTPDEKWAIGLAALPIVLGLYEGAVKLHHKYIKRPARIAAMRKRLDDAR